MTFFVDFFCWQLSQRYFLWTVRSSHPLYPHIPNKEKLTSSLQKKDVNIMGTRQKVVFKYFFMSEMSEKKIHNSTFPRQNLRLECNCFKWDRKVTTIWCPLFYTIWKKVIFRGTALISRRLSDRQFRKDLCW